MWRIAVLLFSTAVLAAAHPTNLKWGDKLPDYGVPNFSCPAETMKASASVPTNVNSVRPADIKVVMAIGDSLTAANGAGAEDPVAIILQYRGLAFQIGGEHELETHATIPNYLKKFNKNLFGYSVGIGSPNVWEIAYLNLAMPGAHAHDMPGQARQLVAALKAHPQNVDMQNDWKLFNIFIGGNDVCNICRRPDESPALWVSQIQEAIQIIYDNVPRVIVSLTSMLHLEMVRKIDRNDPFCTALHTAECHCESDTNFTNTQISDVCNEYARLEMQLQNNATFERDDFTLVTQPFFSNTTVPAMKGDVADLAFFSPDCFHFSQKGHGIVSSYLWENIFQPVGQKRTIADLSNPAPLKCPDPSCPFFRTVKNSQDCSKYMTPSA